MPKATVLLQGWECKTISCFDSLVTPVNYLNLGIDPHCMGSNTEFIYWQHTDKDTLYNGDELHFSFSNINDPNIISYHTIEEKNYRLLLDELAALGFTAYRTQGPTADGFSLSSGYTSPKYPGIEVSVSSYFTDESGQYDFDFIKAGSK